jgi:uncharacterized membrane protein
MKLAHTLLISALFVLTLAAVFLWLYPKMPALVATHWNAQGQVDGYAAPIRAVGVPIVLLVMLALLTVVLPAISPRRYEIKPFAAVFGLLMLATQAFVFVAALGVLLNAAGHHVRMPLLAQLSIGGLMMVIGNYMGKLRKNFFVGIRTPWTLASDDVWARTHRLAGWLFVLAGVLAIGVAVAGAPLRATVAIVLVAALVPCAYSLVIYRRMEGRG